MLATDIIEYLKRPLMSLVATRDGADEPQPLGAIFGPKVMIINEFAGSGGDAMPWYFRRVGAPDLMDGGFASAPSSAVYNPNSDWEVENRGIAPDIEVEHDPEQVRQVRDPQLEKAVQVVLEELEKNPVPQPRRPAYPNYHTAKPAPR
jgi:tricorn protease